ncbi:MAG: SOS response-associated peptidase [Parachlamydiaceae bacterium]|nr:SOS response-associated peptidase [Parachlamydiaceae bacterium]
MCGRFSLDITKIKSLGERFNASIQNIECKPHYNIAPSQQVLTVVNLNEKRTISQMTWGLIPNWSKDGKSNYNLINVRSETLIEKPYFKFCLEKHRCLIPVDGFFEWEKTANGNVPYRVVLRNEPIFSLAGLWDVWKSPTGLSIFSLTIITTKSNDLVSPIHDRMPVILNRENEEKWLDLKETHGNHLQSLLTPFSSDEMDLYRVSTLVNSTKNDVPECILPEYPTI